MSALPSSCSPCLALKSDVNLMLIVLTAMLLTAMLLTRWDVSLLFGLLFPLDVVLFRPATQLRNCDFSIKRLTFADVARIECGSVVQT